MSPIPQRPYIWMAISLPYRILNSDKFHQQLNDCENREKSIYINDNQLFLSSKRISCEYILFKTTIDAMVIQKNAPGQSCVSYIASPTVTMKTITSIIILHTIRGVKLPLKNQIKSHFIFFFFCSKKHCWACIAYILN